MHSQWIIAGAVGSELEGLLNQVRPLGREPAKRGRVWRVQYKGVPFCIVRTGIGPRRARASLRRLLLSGGFRGILSIGFAGALKEGLCVGDILIPSEIVSLPVLSARTYYPDRGLFEAVCHRASRSDWRFHSGRMLTSDRVIFSAREKRLLGEKYNTESVEMESGVLAELAEEASLPLLVVRVVSDEAGVSLPETIVVMDYFRKRQFRNIIRCAISQPKEVLRLFRLIPNIRRASKKLTRFVCEEVLDTLIEASSCSSSTSGI